MKYATFIVVTALALLLSCGSKNKHEVSGESKHTISVQVDACKDQTTPEKRAECFEKLLSLIDKDCQGTPEPPE